MQPLRKSNAFYTAKTTYYEISLFEDVNYEKSGLVCVCAWRTGGPYQGRQVCGPNWEYRTRFPKDLDTKFAHQKLVDYVRDHKRIR